MDHGYRSVHRICAVIALFGAAACGGRVDATGTQEAQSALTNTGDVLGFEVLSDWSSTAGTLALSSAHTQGAASLSVSNVSYAEITSVPLSSLGSVTSTIAYDVMIPTNEPNPGWYGFTQLFVSIPSQGVNNQSIGQVDLHTLPPGSFAPAQFTLSSALIAKLKASYSDLTFKIVLNVPSTAAYLLDNLRFVGSNCVYPSTGLVVTQNTTLCGGTYNLTVADGQAAVTIAANNVTLTCNGTTLVGSGAGSGSPPSAGIRIGASSGVTVSGCTASSFRYGLQATGSTNLTVKNSHFDGNFTDSTQPGGPGENDAVVGGGVGLSSVQGATVQNSTFGNNWNGIELRNSSGVKVMSNTAANCTNTGALVYGTSSSTIQSNDFSFALRPAGLTYPTNWYGAGTQDAAGILLDEGSSNNVLDSNNTQYGGDGIFIRALDGFCGIGGNVVSNNQTSFSPNNAIESWCPNNTFKNNTASSSNYGLWLGGSDAAQVIGNTASNNKVDGFSIQIASDRHSLFQDNIIQNNGRAGILLSGLQFQAGDTLPVPDSRQTAPANSSQLVLQRNTVSGNAVASLFTSETRLLTLASNCGLDSPWLSTDALLIAPATGSCGGSNGRTPPTAALAAPGPVALNTPFTFDASHSALSPAGGTLRFTWLVQPAGAAFSSLPPMLFDGVSSAHQAVTFTAPGLYDVDVSVDDGHLAALAFATAAVVPGGQRFGQSASNWAYQCSMGFQCVATIKDDPNGVEGSSVHVNSNDPFDFSFSTPAKVDASKLGHLGLFLRASNNNAGGWQNFYVMLHTSTGTITYTPPLSVLPVDPASWVYLEIPLSGGVDQGVNWTLTSQGGTRSGLQTIEIHTDTWNANPYDVWVDAVSLY